MEVMNSKTTHNLLATSQEMLAYTNQHFNPKLLPSLIHYILAHPTLGCSSGPQCMHCNQKINPKQQIKLVLNSSNLSLLLANLRVYDGLTIVRENLIIQAMIRWSDKFIRQKPSLSHPSQTQTQRKHLIRLKTEMHSKSRPKATKTERCKSNKKQHLPDLFQFLDYCYKAFLTYEYRLKDLASLAKMVQISLQKEQRQFHYFKHVKQILDYLCKQLLQKIQRTKQLLEECNKIYLQNAEKLALAELQQIFFPNLINEDIPKLLFKIAAYAKQHQIRLRQINIKYTLLSREIMSRQGVRRMKKKQQENAEAQVMDEDQMNQLVNNMSSYPNSKNTLQSNQTTLKNAFSNRSILKNRRGYLKKQKRISIEIITSLIDMERNRKNKLKQDKDSRFKHRLGLNIGSLQNLNNESVKSARKKKKQVKIDQTQISKQNKHDQISERSNSSQCLSEKSKSRRQTNLLKYKELCQKANREQQDDHRSECSIFAKKKYESLYQSGLQSASKCTMLSIESRKSKRRQKKKSTGKYFNKRKIQSSSSCKEIYKRRSLKGRRQKTLNESLKFIFDQAKEKKNDKKLIKTQRSGLVSQNQVKFSQIQLDQIKENFEVGESKKNYKLRMNHKLNKNKYKLILQNFNKSKDSSSYEQNLQTTIKKMEYKGSRRLGDNLNNDFLKVEKQNSDSLGKGNQKNISLADSATSSRRYPFSNTRINNTDGTKKAKQKSVKKMKTEEDEMNKKVHVPAEFKVNFTDRLNIVDDFIKFYPNVECTLHQIAKKKDRLEFLNHGQFQANGRFFEFVPMSNYHISKHIHQQSLEGQIKQRQLQKKIFHEENLKLNFCKKIVAAANQLQQRQLPSYGNGHEIRS